MTIPRIKTMTIDSHDEAIPVIRLRLAEIDGQSLHLAQDIAAFMSLPLTETAIAVRRSTILASPIACRRSLARKVKSSGRLLS